MTQIQKKILETLEPDFRYEDTDWVPAFILIEQLLRQGPSELRALDNETRLLKVFREMEHLGAKHLVELSPSYYRGKLSGFTTRLTAEGHNMFHYGNTSLIG